MTEKQLTELRQWLIDNIFRNPDVMFNDEIRTDLVNDVDIVEVIAWLYELLHREVMHEEYDYMFHWANKIGAWVETKDITK